jgi:hypothetical protein
LIALGFFIKGSRLELNSQASAPYLQKPRGLTCRREKRNRLLVEGNKGFAAEPAALVGNYAIGEIPAGFKY